MLKIFNIVSKYLKLIIEISKTIDIERRAYVRKIAIKSAKYKAKGHAQLHGLFGGGEGIDSPL